MKEGTCRTLAWQESLRGRNHVLTRRMGHSRPDRVREVEAIPCRIAGERLDHAVWAAGSRRWQASPACRQRARPHLSARAVDQGHRTARGRRGTAHAGRRRPSPAALSGTSPWAGPAGYGQRHAASTAMVALAQGSTRRRRCQPTPTSLCARRGWGCPRSGARVVAGGVAPAAAHACRSHGPGDHTPDQVGSFDQPPPEVPREAT